MKDTDTMTGGGRWLGCEVNIIYLGLFDLSEGTWWWTDEMRASEPSMPNWNSQIEGRDRASIYVETELQKFVTCAGVTDATSQTLHLQCNMGKF